VSSLRGGSVACVRANREEKSATSWKPGVTPEAFRRRGIPKSAGELRVDLQVADRGERLRDRAVRHAERHLLVEHRLVGAGNDRRNVEPDLRDGGALAQGDGAGRG